MMDKPLVTPDDELQPDDGEQFSTSILTVDQHTYQISMEWPDGKQPSYVQMSSELFIEWVEMLNAHRRLNDLLLAQVTDGYVSMQQSAEIARLKRELRFG